MTHDGPGRYEPSDAVFENLMAFRIRDVLLVSSPYDRFILQEDALLGESLDVEYRQLNLSAAPRITQVATGEEALAALGTRPFDLVITMTRLGEMEIHEFGRAVKKRHPDLPVALLAYSPAEAARIKDMGWADSIDRVFIWRGDVQLFLAIVKHFEDLRNAERDVAVAGVRVIILIENSVRFYSSYLPLLYTELMKQSQAVMADGVNEMQRLRRMRARPKILLGETFEEGCALFDRYRGVVLAVISDARFPRAGVSDPEAGIEFVRRVKAQDPDMPVLVQSYDVWLAERAHALGAAFLHKRSPRLLEELGTFIRANLGFGDFVFMTPEGAEIERVRDLAAMPEALRRVPAESLRYHATRNHFSNWCMARTEFALAERIRPVKVSEFGTIEELRRYLIEAFEELQSATLRGVIADFPRVRFGEDAGFARIGGGSLGGKGRGLAFIHSLLARPESLAGTEGVRIYLPPCVVIGTEVFDDFMRENGLLALALSDASDKEIARAFLAAPLPKAAMESLRVYVERVREPVAVRSSSLLEDSHDQPFAGIYRTCMLANNEADEDARLGSLCDAIRLVYASTYSSNAKAYLQTTHHRMEEEKMAVVLQRLAGRRRDERYFYPDYAGVARSYNHYPVLDVAPEDGVAIVALGFGKTVVNGERAVRFSPGNPQNLPQFSSAVAYLENAQRQFHALDLERSGAGPVADPDDELVPLGLDVAEAHGTLGPVGSVYSPDNDAVYDGISRQGIRLATFVPLLKSEACPLPRVLKNLLALGTRAMSCPVEMEFAVTLDPDRKAQPEFAFLQIRPMTIEAAAADIEEIVGRVEASSILCRSRRALGQGRIRDIADIVYVKPDDFDRSHTRAVAGELEKVNAALAREERPYLLIGPGRWGTADPWLGIPVEWHEISWARAIVETDLADVPVPPSEGTHFFQNLTSLGIGYFTVHAGEDGGFVDFAWLHGLAARTETTHLRHVRLDQPLDIWVDGRSRRGVVLKTAAW